MTKVLATDIFDPELTELRKKRWSQAFSESATSDGSIIINDARATVVLEHIMQASDVAHTMQHWHTYRRFNANLFRETAAAYRQGRCAVDPATFWYEGELKFFDSYMQVQGFFLSHCVFEDELRFRLIHFMFVFCVVAAFPWPRSCAIATFSVFRAMNVLILPHATGPNGKLAVVSHNAAAAAAAGVIDLSS